MEAVKMKAVVDESHVLSLQLPANFPPGEADVIVLSTGTVSPPLQGTFEERLNRWIARVPPVPHLSPEQISRDSIYE